MSKPDKRDFEERYAACFVDFGIKTATGIFIGSMMGTFFLRSYRRWPMVIGGGLGFGMAYTNCENSLNSFLLAMDPKVCNIKNWFRVLRKETYSKNACARGSNGILSVLADRWDSPLLHRWRQLHARATRYQYI